MRECSPLGWRWLFCSVLTWGCASEGDPWIDTTLGGGGAGGASGGPGEASEEPAAATDCEVDCLPREYANWPMPNPPGLPWSHAARFTEAGALVVESVTGLEWTPDFLGPVTHEEATLHCADLVFGGHDDYRLPTRIELVTLLDRTRVPTIHPLFGETPADYFWSSSRVHGSEELAYSVYFGLGETGTGQRQQASAYARCVRGGHRAGVPRHESGNGWVKDRATALVWEASPPDRPLNRQSAYLYCKEKSSDQGDAWRLPTDQELQTLVDERREELIDPLFIGSPRAPFWAWSPPTATPLVVDFDTGMAVVAAEDALHFVRCAHDAAPGLE